jgi:AcrR family transcriptional regulator
MSPPRSYKMETRADAAAASRERIARAALKLLLEQAFEDVSLASIGAAAGVSHQTLLNHFGSKEGIALAAADILKQETLEARAKATPGNAREAITVLVGEYERFGDANARWAASAERLGSLAPLLDSARQEHRAWLKRIFAAELPSDPAALPRTINALHAATDVYTWKLLRRDIGLSRAETEKTLLALCEGVTRGARGARKPKG